MTTPALTLADILDRFPPTALPAVMLPDRRRAIVLGRSSNGQYAELGSGGIVVPRDPATLVELITDPAARAMVLTDAFACTRSTYLHLCERMRQAEQDRAGERHNRILRDVQLQQRLGRLVDTGRLHAAEAETLLREQLTPLPQPRLRVTVALVGTFDIEAEPDRTQMADFDDLLTADLARIHHSVTGGDQFHVAPGSTMRMSVTRVERLTDQPDGEATD